MPVISIYPVIVTKDQSYANYFWPQVRFKGSVSANKSVGLCEMVAQKYADVDGKLLVAPEIMRLGLGPGLDISKDAVLQSAFNDLSTSIITYLKTQGETADNYQIELQAGGQLTAAWMTGRVRLSYAPYVDGLVSATVKTVTVNDIWVEAGKNADFATVLTAVFTALGTICAGKGF